MDFGALADSIWKQFVTVWNAPVPFLAALIASWFVIRWFIRGHYETRIANGESTIAMLERKLDRQLVEESATIAGALAPPQDVGAKQPNAAFRAYVKSAQPEMKEYVAPTVTLEYLKGLQRADTPLSEQLKIRELVGKWMKIEAAIDDIRLIDKSIAVSLRDPGAPHFPRVSLFFDDHEEKLSHYHVGDMIRAEGQLLTVSQVSVAFVKCGLVV